MWIAVGVAGMVLWAATPQSTVNDVIEVVRSGMRERESDGVIAKSLRRLKLAESMDVRVIEELESAGAGARTIAELTQLREAARELPAPAGALPFESPPGPAADERARVLNEARSAALNYSRSLPDFICMQRVRRSDNARGVWRVKDTLDIRLTYFGEKEDYRLLNINGRPAVRGYRDVGGATSQGEFGSLLRLVFEPASKTGFTWDHWTTLRKRRAHVFAFKTAVRLYRLEFGRGSARMGVSVGQRGFVYVDRETNDILRIIAEADGIPPRFPVESSSTVLDYAITKVGARDFLLPLRAEIRMTSDGMMIRNEVEFVSRST